jgi:hypothetical protein
MQEKLEKRIYRNRKQQRLELKLIYEKLMEGKANKQIITELNLTEDTYYRYKRMLMEECDAEFKNLAKEPGLEVGIATAMFHDRLSELYNLCRRRLNNTDKNDRGFSDLVEVTRETSEYIFRLETQGVQAAIEIAKRANTIDNRTGNSSDNTFGNLDGTIPCQT